MPFPLEITVAGAVHVLVDEADLQHFVDNVPAFPFSFSTLQLNDDVEYVLDDFGQPAVQQFNPASEEALVYTLKKLTFFPISFEGEENGATIEIKLKNVEDLMNVGTFLELYDNVFMDPAVSDHYTNFMRHIVKPAAPTPAEDLEYEDYKKAYRALAKMAHPDRGTLKKFSLPREVINKLNDFHEIAECTKDDNEAKLYIEEQEDKKAELVAAPMLALAAARDAAQVAKDNAQAAINAKKAAGMRISAHEQKALEDKEKDFEDKEKALEDKEKELEPDTSYEKVINKRMVKRAINTAIAEEDAYDYLIRKYHELAQAAEVVDVGLDEAECRRRIHVRKNLVHAHKGEPEEAMPAAPVAAPAPAAAAAPFIPMAAAAAAAAAAAPWPAAAAPAPAAAPGAWAWAPAPALPNNVVVVGSGMQNEIEDRQCLRLQFPAWMKPSVSKLEVWCGGLLRTYNVADYASLGGINLFENDGINVQCLFAQSHQEQRHHCAIKMFASNNTELGTELFFQKIAVQGNQYRP